jgi:hypothetical protein
MRGRSLVTTRCVRWIAGGAISFSLLMAVSLRAEEPFTGVSDPKPAPAKSERNLIERTGWIRLEMIGGRIAVLGHRCGQSRVVQIGESTDIPREQLSVQLQTESLLVHYEDLQVDRQITVDLDDQQRLSIIRTGASPSAELKLVQPFRGPLTLTVGREPAQTFTAGTIWHLALKQPELCDESLFPLLETFRPHWRLKEQATGLQEALVSKAGSNVLAERAQWRQWVARLDSDDFAERQHADRQLRASGQAVVAWLQRLDRKQLSAEQTGRVNDICQALADLSTDTPQRVAAWLIDDRCAWLALLNHQDASVRLAAANHLTLLCGKPLSFDPLASSSDRQQQLAQLQQRFGKP